VLADVVQKPEIAIEHDPGRRHGFKEGVNALEVSDERAVCQHHENSLVWSATMAGDPFRGRGTVFGDVRVTLADGHELSPQQVWINDLAELRTSARGRSFGEVVRNLGRGHPTSEYQKIVAELHRIGTALLTDNSVFPDPLFRNTKPEKEAVTGGGPVGAPPVDPEQLIRSIEIHGAPEHAHSAYGLNGVTLTGVLRALFDIPDEELESSATEESNDPDGPDPQPGSPPPRKPPTLPHPPMPPERARIRLRRDMDEFVRKLAEKEFAANCTVTHLVQAVAYPLAVIANGTRGGWIDPTSGQDWTTRVFDTSFCAPYPVRAVGLLNAVRQRCEASGELQAFRAIVGDGTLWAAMLASVSRTVWVGANSGLKKAFALRTVLLSQELLASAEAGRMSSLITNVERQSGLSSVLNLARDAKAILTAFEKYLVVNWDDLIKRQISCKPAHLPGDVLFHLTGGWAFVMEPIGNIDETKLRVYRQNSAGEIRVSSGFYLNVTRSAEGDAKLLGWLKQLGHFGK